MDTRNNTSKQGEQLLRKLSSVGLFLYASLVVRNKRCGRSDCRCATEGPVHPTANVTWKEGEKTRTLHVPLELIEEVAQSIEEWKKAFPKPFGSARNELWFFRRQATEKP